ncbi:hypothetical protein NADFUDRAFT_46307, partial [Nadsonia fulvescens var. elongata DSM 6958]
QQKRDCRVILQIKELKYSCTGARHIFGSRYRKIQNKPSEGDVTLFLWDRLLAFL